MTAAEMGGTALCEHTRDEDLGGPRERGWGVWAGERGEGLFDEQVLQGSGGGAGLRQFKTGPNVLPARQAPTASC